MKTKPRGHPYTIGQRVRTPEQYSADRVCRHCKGTGIIKGELFPIQRGVVVGYLPPEDVHLGGPGSHMVQVRKDGCKYAAKYIVTYWEPET